jgi:hypothetical protein
MIKLVKTLSNLKTIQTFVITKKIDCIPHLYVAFCGNCNYAKEMSNLIEVLNEDGISYEIEVLSV